MIKEAIGIGRGVEEARERALEQLGPQEADVQFEVLELPKKSFFGLKQTPARVRAYVVLPDPPPAPKAERPAQTKQPTPKTESAPKIESKPTPKTEPKQAPKAESKPTPKAESQPEGTSRRRPAKKPRQQPDAPAKEVDPIKVEKAQEYLTEVIAAMGLNGLTLTPGIQDGAIHIRVEGEDSSAVIGRRGETLNALQYLTSLAANRGEGNYARVVIDTGGYREARQDTLSALARRLAERVVRTGRSHTLEPMNAYERRIIHSAVSEVKGATSASVGEEPNRRVVISSKRHTGQSSERTGGQRRTSKSDRPKSDRPKSDKPERGERRGGRDRRGGRREKPAPYVESSTREVPPQEAADKPLYGKIEL